MVRSIRYAGATTLLLLLFSGALHAQEGQANAPQDAQFVYIDSQQLLQEAPGAQDAQRTWNQELGEYRAEIGELTSEIDSLRQEYNRQQAMLSDSARERRAQEIAEKQRELQTRTMELEQTASRRQQELLEPILTRVGEVLDEVREERGYELVFDISASGLVSASQRLDITDLVLERLRAAADESGGE